MAGSILMSATGRQFLMSGVPGVGISVKSSATELRVQRRPNDRDGLPCGLTRSPWERLRRSLP